MNIVVLAGGLSPERDVSLTSGSLIAAALKRKGHKVLLLDVYLGISKIPDDPYSLFTSNESEKFSVSHEIPDLDALKKESGNGERLIGDNVLPLCAIADAVFLALHGAMGENGQLQATLDNFGIKNYSGSGYIGSLLAMDKNISKQLLHTAGVNTPKWVYCTADKVTPEYVEGTVGLPCVIKPCSCGSSVGISIVNTRDELEEALEFAVKYEDKLVIEEKIEGREFTMGILDGVTLPPVEIIPKNGFYDYKNKYQAGATTEICPAKITSDELFALSEATKAVFDTLQLSGYARIDYIMDKNGKVWCLEANTLPGMTPTSLLPQEAAAIGIEYDELCEKIAMLAYNKK